MTHGLIVEDFYLYTSGKTKIFGTCKYSSTSNPQVKTSGPSYVDISPTPVAMILAVKIKPVSVGIL